MSSHWRSVALVTALLASVLPAAAAASPPGGGHDVIANLFEWPWTSVAAECGNQLGPKGYGAVQVSPPEESASVAGHPWWEVYQPVSYQLTSRMGNREQFAAMVSACHAAGVKVYADAVINHMAGQASTGYGGSTAPDKYTYPGTYSSADFHHHPDPCPQPDGQIHNYGSQAEVQECELVQLADLYTEHDYVRGRIAGYLNDLLSLGVDGFRVDAVKHINPSDIAGIESKLSKPTYLYQEVIYGAGEAVQPQQYEGTGDLLEFRYGTNLKAKFASGNLADLNGFGQSWGMEPGNKAVVFVDNHDTQRNGSTLSYKDGAIYQLATVFGLAWDYGTPTVMSSFDFSGNDQSPPSAANGMVSAVTCGSGWQCEHRQRWAANMVGFHNAAAGAPVANWWSDGSNQIAFSRGGSGFVAINKEGGTLSRAFTTGLPAGDYCDVLHGELSGGSCTGPVISVDSSGTARTTVGPMDAIAIHVGARISGARVAATFTENANTSWGQNVYVVGSIPALGGWNPANGVPLSSAGYPNWSATVSLPANTSFQYKYVKRGQDGSTVWESDPNRSASTGSSTALNLADSWR
ncbi:carbohydrate-binding module family 20 domain-containing protein [Kutzneria viridogrisea]|uniref:Alpha-amylase n=1 Tax=Kutzneria viridogrisea TaxID=47990 RepID=A0ABR6BPA8_9PSEU|nr:alpha-amylase [Kutzneria viridogrisea]